MIDSRPPSPGRRRRKAQSVAVSSLLDRRLVVVTGKGGVGKTTVAAALGLLAARAGKRTVICEVAEQERLSDLFGVDASGHEERELAPNLHSVSVDPELAKEEWLRYQLKSGTLAGVLGGSSIFRYLSAAAPGLSELVTIGKVWDLAQLERRTSGSVFDLAIVDAPATGHGIAMLRAPSTYASVARVGPIRRQALQIDAFLRDGERTAVVVVAAPEEMPVNETLDLERRLAEEMEMKIDRAVVNALYPERFAREEAERLRAVAEDDGDAVAAERPGGTAALRAALAEVERVRGQRSQLRRLRRGLDAPVATLPFLFEPELGLEQLEQLARRLERAL
jgi:anion-transporting  ArsA/GET3 family ATPase